MAPSRLLFAVMQVLIMRWYMVAIRFPAASRSGWQQTQPTWLCGVCIKRTKMQGLMQPRR